MSTTALADRHRVSGCENCHRRKQAISRRLQAHSGTIRGRSRITSFASRGAAEIRPAAVPGEIRVGERRTVRVDLAATRIISPIDPDFCVSRAVSAGLRVEARGRVGGGRTSERFCLPASGLTLGNTREFRIPVEGTSPGTLEVTVEVVGRDSNNLLARETFSIAVVGEETGSQEPGGIPDDEQGPQDPDDDERRDGPFAGLFDTLDSASTGAIAVLLFVALVAAAG